MARGQLDAFGRYQIKEWIVPWRHRPVHGRDHALVLLRAGDREYVRVALCDLLRLGAHAAGHDHLAVSGQRVADGGERLRLRAVEKAAGVHDGEVGTAMAASKLIALRAQPRDDALGIDQRLGAAERDKADFWRLKTRVNALLWRLKTRVNALLGNSCLIHLGRS